MNMFDHIRVEAANFPVQRMCALLGVSRSGYYGYLARRGQPPPRENTGGWWPRSGRRVVLREPEEGVPASSAHHHAFATRTEAYDVVERYIDGFYNPTRRHSALGYESSLRYEQMAAA